MPKMCTFIGIHGLYKYVCFFSFLLDLLISITFLDFLKEILKLLIKITKILVTFIIT